MTDASFGRSLGRIEGKQDLILNRIDHLYRENEAVKGEIVDLGKRVTRVERKTTYWTGAIATVSAGVYFFKDKIVGVFS